MGKSSKSRSTFEIISFCAPFSWKNISWQDRMIFSASVTLLICFSLFSIASSIILRDVINYLAQGDIAYYYIIAYCICYYLAECCNNLKSFCFIYVEAKIQTQLSALVFNHVLNLSMPYHLSRETGKVLKELQRGSISVPQVIRTGLFYVFPIILQLGLIEIYLFWKFDQVYTAVLFCSVIFYILFTILTSEWRSKIQRTVNTSDSSFVSKATDALYNCETVKLNNGEDHETSRCADAFSKFRLGKVSMHKSLLILHMGQEFIVTIGNFLCLGLLAYEIIEGQKLIGDFVMMQGFLALLYSPLKNMGTYYETIKQALIDSEGIMNLLSLQPCIKDDPSAINLKECSGSISFQNVNFTYSPDLPQTLHNISFSLSSSKSLGIVGQTGSGKSTISKLLFRLYDVTSGQVLIDNIDVRKISQSSLRSQISIVPQDCALFNETIAYNIGYACTCNMAHIEWAASMAKIHDFIMTLPQGYLTLVGEKGIRLSGGERQRVAIARALIRKPKIICFDEATSSLDSLTEEKIHESIREISKTCTSVIIAHRLSSVTHCNEIIVVDQGRVGQRGTHLELLQEDGVYRDMWKQQLEGN